jgi:hypothetical protein
MSAVKRVEFVNDRMSFIILRGVALLSLAVSKQETHRFHMEMFNLKKLKEVEGKVQFRVEVSNRYAALEHLYAEVKINSAWENITENINISARD